MGKVARYITIDLLKNKVVIGFFLLFLVLSGGTLMLENQPEKALLTLMQLVLLLLPVVTIVFTATYYYNAQEFIALILSQPIARGTVFKGFYIGISSVLITAYCLGLCLPLVICYPTVENLFLATGGIFLILIFVALALFATASSRDKVRGLGSALLLWVLFAFVYDGVLLFMMLQFAEYPVEGAILVLSFFNPLDIIRILIIMQTESSAMLGLSGAVFHDFFGAAKGIATSIVVLILWVVIPFLFAQRRFIKKDL